MEDRFIYKGTKKLRCGFTTGSCAAAAAKAAAELLLGGRITDRVRLVTPSGAEIAPELVYSSVGQGRAVCGVKKDSGDDPDVTNGIEIFAEVTLAESGVTISGGKGIGRVTKPGLDQPVGEWAINSVPRKMITRAVTEVAELYGCCCGFRVVISAPAGEELAKKTFNPRMGIVGGISIIGTTGIVEPMSDPAIVETIRAEANMRRAAGHGYLLLNVGNYSGDFLKMNAADIAEKSVTCSNFIGDAIDIGVSMGFKGILLVGHIGKLAKLGSGIMNTHSAYADGRMETLMACGVLAGVGSDVLSELDGCMTVDAALDILYEKGCAEKILEVLCGRAERYLKARTKGEAEIGAVIFSDKHSLVLKTSSADRLLELISEE